MKNIMTNEIKKVKDDLIAELDKRIVDKIIEKTNADLLKKLIEQAETINEAIMIAELGTTYKRTGFHFDKRLEKMTDTIKYFKKNKKLSFVQDKNALTHKLIIGDNYDALLNLLIEYRGKIDVIYIDPPYGKDSMGEFAKTNYENAITRDNLLSMLYPRLVLARQLLSDNGVIFCSIDDKNQAYVKGLFDEVFEESNCAGTYFWKKTETPPALSYKIRKKLEYVLCYTAKNLPKREFAQGLVDGGDAPLLNSGNPIGILTFPAGSIKFNIPDGVYKNQEDYRVELLEPLEVEHGVNSKSIKLKGTFKWGQQYLDNEIEKGTYFLIKSKEFSIRYQKPEKATKVPSSVIDTPEVGVGTNETGAKELSDVGLEDKFANPKATALIAYLSKIAFWENKNTIILDFFAGSGTTGQAVLELNKDGGKRQFILTTANEITDTTPNGIVNDVTSKRLKRVMTGECYDGTKDFKWNEENKPLGDNLDVYDIETVANFEGTKDKTPFDTIDETFYGQERLGVNEKIKWVCENFEVTQKTLENK